MVAGLCANAFKTTVEHTAYTLGLTKVTGVNKAAGFFLSSRKANTFKGKLIGLLSDNNMALLMGLFASYLFTFTGKDNPGLKGLVIGNLSWSIMWGIMSRFGATKVIVNDPNSHLTSMLSHTLFGITSTYLLTKIADPDLYDPHFKSLDMPHPQNDSEMN